MSTLAAMSVPGIPQRSVPDPVARRFSSYSELEEANNAITALVSSPGWALVREIAMERHGKLADNLDLMVQPHVRYVADHSERVGIKRVLEIPDAVRKAYLAEDEKQRQAAERQEASGG